MARNLNADEVKALSNKDRKTILLKAAYELLKKCNDGPYVKDVLSETAFYDDAECDGWCLATDIAYELDLEEPDNW